MVNAITTMDTGGIRHQLALNVKLRGPHPSFTPDREPRPPSSISRYPYTTPYRCLPRKRLQQLVIGYGAATGAFLVP